MSKSPINCMCVVYLNWKTKFVHIFSIKHQYYSISFNFLFLLLFFTFYIYSNAFSQCCLLNIICRVYIIIRKLWKSWKRVAIFLLSYTSTNFGNLILFVFSSELIAYMHFCRVCLCILINLYIFLKEKNKHIAIPCIYTDLFRRVLNIFR